VGALSGVRLGSADLVGQLLLLREVVLRYHHVMRAHSTLHPPTHQEEMKKAYVDSAA
jgi:hypothetical protein